MTAGVMRALREERAKDRAPTPRDPNLAELLRTRRLG